MSQHSLTIGIDYGNVCSQDAHKHEDDVFAGETGINVPGCLEALQILRAQGHRLILISFCGRNRAKRTREYLDSLDEKPFHEVYFVKNRNYKAHVCQQRGVDIMIDDRMDILKTVAPTLSLHFGSHPSDKACKYNADYSAASWSDVLTLLPRVVVPQQPLVLSAVDVKYCY